MIDKKRVSRMDILVLALDRDKNVVMFMESHSYVSDNYTSALRRGRRVYCFTSVQDIFRRIFLSNCWWQKSDTWSQASYRYAIFWVAFLDLSDSYFLFADLVGFYTHWTYLHIFSSHFSQQLLMAEIWYLVSSFI